MFCAQVQCLEGGVTNASPGREAKSLNICSVGLESECPGIGKIEGELFIPRENFSFSEIVVKVSCQTERSEVWQA